MRRLLLWVALGVMVSQATTLGVVVDFFPVTGDGSFNLNHSEVLGLGYTNAGIVGVPGLFKVNYYAAWMTFAGSVGDLSGMTLAQFLMAQPDYNTATLFFRTDSPLPAPGGGALPVAAVIESIRSLNEGGMLEDAGVIGAYAYAAPAPGYQGASELQAFRGCQVPGAGFVTFGDGIYVNRDPNPPGPDQGVPWITPSGRLPSGRNGFIFGPGQAIQYDTDNDGTNGLTGLFDGWQQNGMQSANFWALEDLLGARQNNGFLASAAQAYNSGQILVGGAASPTVVNLSQAVGTYDPRNKNNDDTDSNWYAVPIDAAFLYDIAFNPEHKGLVFLTNTGMTSQNWGNQGFYAREESGGIYEPYLAISIPVRIAGDVDGDGDVDIFDVIDTIAAFGSVPGDPNWNHWAGFDGDGLVGVFDVIDCISNFGTGT